MQISNIKVENEYRFGNIINELEAGKLKIPRFQREFVWEQSKVIELLDSIYKEFPIGSFFIWVADEKYKEYFRDIPELGLPRPSHKGPIDFILDGQQRITSLYVTIKGKSVGDTNYSHIAFDLDRQIFTLHLGKYKYGGSVVPLYKLFNDEHLQVYDALTQEQKKMFAKCRATFENYPLSVIRVHEKDLVDAIVIFERINQGGKPLSIFDLVVAGTWGFDFDLREKFEELERRIKDKGFGKIKPEVVLHILGLVVKGYCNKINLLAITKEEASAAWPDIEKAVEQAVDYLRSNLGVKIYDFLPYPPILSLLAYLYFKIDGRTLSPTISKTVNQWFWQSALSERYARSRETTMGEDRKRIFDPLIVGKDVRFTFPVNVTPERLLEIKISTKSAIRNAYFCFLAKAQPQHFLNNTLIQLDYNLCSQYNNSEKHHIFPRAFLASKNIKGKNLMLNFCFIPAELNKEISDSSPNEYFSKYRKENGSFLTTLKSHYIPYGDFIESNDFDRFLITRARLISDALVNQAGSVIIGSDSNRAISDIETMIRDHIDQILVEAAGENYWKQRIPGNVQETIKTRIMDYAKKIPDIQPEQYTNRDRLDQADIMDYPQIIMNNWEVFEPTFKSRGEVEKRFLGLRELRNCIAHNKPVDSVVRKDGEAAIEWLYRALRRSEDVIGPESENLFTKEELETISKVRDEVGKKLNIPFNLYETEPRALSASRIKGEIIEHCYELLSEAKYLPSLQIWKCSYYTGNLQMFICLQVNENSEEVLECLKASDYFHDWLFKPEINGKLIASLFDLNNEKEFAKKLESAIQNSQEIINRCIDKRKKAVYTFKIETAVASGALLPGQDFIVFNGSTARIKEASSFKGSSGQKLRAKLVKDGVLARQDNELYVFTHDYIFSSPSAAGDTITGHNTNGWNTWKNIKGETLEGVRQKTKPKNDKDNLLIKFLNNFNEQESAVIQNLKDYFQGSGWLDFGNTGDRMTFKMRFAGHQINPITIRSDRTIKFRFGYLISDRELPAKMVNAFKENVLRVFSGQPVIKGSHNDIVYEFGQLLDEARLKKFKQAIDAFIKDCSEN